MSIRTQINAGLEEIGACWAGTDGEITLRNYCEHAAYQIHPDAAAPYEGDVLFFGSLRDILEWIEARKEAAAFSRATGRKYAAIFDGNTWFAEEV